MLLPSIQNPTLGPGPLADSTGAAAARLLSQYAIPERLLDKSASDLLAPPPYATAYADRDRTYPIHAPAGAWASAAAYHASRSTDPDVADKIKEACDWFGISSEWDRLQSQRPAAPTAPTVQHWALPTAQRYPLDDARQVKAAIDYFQRYGDRLSADDRRTYAGELVKAAAAHPSLFSEKELWRFEAEAGLGKPAPGWQTELTWRAKCARDRGEHGLAALFTKIAADEAALHAVGVFRNAGQLADLLRQADARFSGWNNGDPLQGLVGDTPSTARNKLAGAVQSASGHWYRRDELDRLPDAVCTAIGGLGPIVTRDDKAQKLATSIDFERLAQINGVQPIEYGRERTDWSALAAA